MSTLLDFLGAVAVLGVVVLLLLALAWAWRVLWANPLTLWRRLRMRWTTAQAKRKVRRAYVQDALRRQRKERP